MSLESTSLSLTTPLFAVRFFSLTAEFLFELFTAPVVPLPF